MRVQRARTRAASFGLPFGLAVMSIAAFFWLVPMALVGLLTLWLALGSFGMFAVVLISAGLLGGLTVLWQSILARARRGWSVKR